MDTISIHWTCVSPMRVGNIPSHLNAMAMKQEAISVFLYFVLHFNKSLINAITLFAHDVTNSESAITMHTELVYFLEWDTWMDTETGTCFAWTSNAYSSGSVATYNLFSL